MRIRQALPALLVPAVCLVAGCTTGTGSASVASTLTTEPASPANAVPAVSASSTPVTSAPARSPASAAPAHHTSTAASPTGQQSAVPAEKNPPGDIPDNLAFVRYTNAAGRYAFDHPEGWSETSQGSEVTFTDKLNGVQVMPGADATPPTVALARSRDAAALARSQDAFELRSITSVTEPAGAGVRIVYRRNSLPDPVTGKRYRDEVERYELVSKGHVLVMELFGPVGADNVDAYRTMVQSLRPS